MDTVHNERTKLISTALNNLGVATIAGGILAPTIGYLYGSSALDTGGWWLTIAITWLSFGIGLHVLGWIVLGWLKP